jgi:hypothetical protein
MASNFGLEYQNGKDKGTFKMLCKKSVCGTLVDLKLNVLGGRGGEFVGPFAGEWNQEEFSSTNNLSFMDLFEGESLKVFVE